MYNELCSYMNLTSTLHTVNISQCHGSTLQQLARVCYVLSNRDKKTPAMKNVGLYTIVGKKRRVPTLYKLLCSLYFYTILLYATINFVTANTFYIVQLDQLNNECCYCNQKLVSSLVTVVLSLLARNVEHHLAVTNECQITGIYSHNGGSNT